MRKTVKKGNLILTEKKYCDIIPIVDLLGYGQVGEGTRL